MSKGQLIVISGPSGVGKSTVIRRVMERHPLLRFSVSATTRDIRPGETDGVNYYFVSRERFQTMADGNELLEHAEYVGNCYGTPAKPIDEAMDLGYDILLDIEVCGALQVKEKRPDAVTIFLAAPSFGELERRLRSRGDTAPEKIQKRLETARREYTMAPRYDYLVVSETDNVEKAAGELSCIIEASHYRTRNRLNYLKEER
ncbi:MAG: guanylate kinase [Oscillospiraceae bacterium]|nr:guanylate kinase [Oscillospiraceae bacterium]